MRVLLSILIGLITVFPAQSARFIVLKSDQDSLVISMKGKIDFNDPWKLQSIVGLNPVALTRIIFLNSEGGLVQPALKLGFIVYHNRLTTIIAEDANCYSACSMIFVAGRTRNGIVPSRVKYQGGKLGVHRPFSAGSGRENEQWNRLLKAYFDYMNAGPIFYKMTMTTPSETMRLIGDLELEAMGHYRIAQGKSQPFRGISYPEPEKDKNRPADFSQARSERDFERWQGFLLKNSN